MNSYLSLARPLEPGSEESSERSNRGADEADDEGTNSMMSDFITEQEKTVWMMSAWLEESI